MRYQYNLEFTIWGQYINSNVVLGCSTNAGIKNRGRIMQRVLCSLACPETNFLNCTFERGFYATVPLTVLLVYICSFDYSSVDKQFGPNVVSASPVGWCGVCADTSEQSRCQASPSFCYLFHVFGAGKLVLEQFRLLVITVIEETVSFFATAFRFCTTS